MTKSRVPFLTIAILAVFASTPASGIEFGSCVAPVAGDLDGDGFSPTGGDCNEANPAQHPGADESCNGFDDDCNGVLDDRTECRPACDALVPTGSPHLVATNRSGNLRALVWTGDRYAAFWQSPGVNVVEYSVVVPAAGAGIVRALSGGNRADVIWTGSQFGVLTSGAGSVHFTRLDADGRSLQESLTWSPATGAALVWSGTEFGVVWIDNNVGTRFQRVSPGGIALGGPGFLGNHRLGQLQAVWNGSTYAAVLGQQSPTRTLFLEWDAEGNPLRDPVDLSAAFQTNDPFLRWTGIEYGVFWNTATGARFTRLDTTGQLAGPVLGLGFKNMTSVAWSGSEYLVTWDDLQQALVRLSPAGTAIGDIQSFTETGQVATWNGNGFGLLYASAADGMSQMNLLEVTCGCSDGDGDGVDDCFDCDDGDATVFPGARQVCDGQNNDCDDPVWPAAPTNDEDTDDDGDGLSECAGDCDDTHAGVYPGAPEVCDGVNNDCTAPDWPDVATTDRDDDADGVPVCADCDDADAPIFPGAAQLCDGINNDCNAPTWPATPADELDQDGDGAGACHGDCADTDPERSPCAVETCNDIDDDCDLLVDEGPLGEDTDGDGTKDLCDNCAGFFNPGQSDSDADTFGDVCDNCPDAANVDQADEDDDLFGDVCDGCPGDPVNDPDDDAVCHGADNCPAASNPDQSDLDQDGKGDVCDPCPLAELDDSDGDSWCDDEDNCPATYNELQRNDDDDAFGNLCDNCPNATNDLQSDSDDDGTGDACDPCTDTDDDGFGDPGFAANTCGADNCPFVFNDTQSDVDADGVGNSCDNCAQLPNVDQTDGDEDGLGDVCDNCPEIWNEQQSNSDGDAFGDACDVCPFVRDQSQSDLDGDGEGDLCDPDDGLIYVLFESAAVLTWQEEEPFLFWNVYRGELATLVAIGDYTQLPLSNPQAARACGLIQSRFTDTVPMDPGTVAYFLTTGRTPGGEGDLGNDSSGAARPNAHPCP